MDDDGEVSGSVSCRKIDVYASVDAEYGLPSKRATTSRQLRALAAEVPVDWVITSCGKGRCDTEGLFWASQGVKQV